MSTEGYIVTVDEISQQPNLSQPERKGGQFRQLLDDMGIIDESIREKFELYYRFDDLDVALNGIQRLRQRGDMERCFSPEEIIEFNNLQQQIINGVEILDLSRQSQKRHGLVEKSLWRGNDIQEVMESGAVAMEIDVRLSADGKFFITHKPKVDKKQKISKMTASEISEQTDILPLEQALEVLSKYKKYGHKLIIELKTLGPKFEDYSDNLDNLKNLLDKKGVRESVAISSLSPRILAATHEAMPEMPLIMNTAIAPIISYPQEKGFGATLVKIGKKLVNLKNRLLKTPNKWFRLGPKKANILVCSAEGAMKYPEEKGVDGEGRETQYFMTTIPEEVLNPLHEQHKDKVELGGAASMAAVIHFTDVLEIIGFKKKAASIRSYYLNKLHNDLGVNAQVQFLIAPAEKRMRDLMSRGFSGEKGDIAYHVNRGESVARLALKLMRDT